MFESACAPKDQPETANENEGSASHDASATTPTAGSSSRTPTASSSTHTESQMGIATSSEDPSFQAFSQSDEQNGLMTSTPAAHRTRQASNKIFNKDESMEYTSADESLRTRMRRQMENLQLDASLDMSDTSESTAPISLSTISSSLSSAQPKGEQIKPSVKGKGRAPDLRAKALQNVALGTMQKAYAPVFTERSSISSSNLSMLSSIDNSSVINAKPKPSTIFNPAEVSNKQAPSIFTRPFAHVPATSSTSAAQQRLVHNLLKEAEQDKRSGMPIGTTLPTRSPARFNALRHAFDSANAISLSTDDDTMSTRAGEIDVPTDMYGNEVFGAQLDDSYSDSDDEDDEDDGDPGGHIAHMPVMPEQYAMEDGDSFESTGSWHAANHDGTTNVFAGGRAAPAGGAFQLADIYRGVEPDSFVAETPIITRRAEPRHLG